MSDQLPPGLVQLIQQCPLPEAHDRDRLLAGDLALGARLYGEQAAYYGSQGDWWRVWREIERARGRSLVDALEELAAGALYFYSSWAFEQGEGDEGRIAYRRYLDRPENRPTERLNAAYLDHLLQQGRYTEVLETAADLASRSEYDDQPVEEMRAARALFCLGDRKAAFERLDPVRDRYHDDGKLWAVTAILHKQSGDHAGADRALAECAKLGLYDERLIQELLHVMGCSTVDWEIQHAAYSPEWLGFDEKLRHHAADPGARLRPTDQPSPHWFGENDFAMPPCWGCGHSVRQWFLLDLREIEPLRARLSSWTRFPLLGCTDCCFWIGRHDYEVDLRAMSIRLVNAAFSYNKAGVARGMTALVPRQFARLQWLPARSDPTSEELTANVSFEQCQVAGTPFWVQHPLRVFCKTCRQEMAFVAALATPTEFTDQVWITNGDGFLYHFACDACHTISVIAQHT